MNDERSTAGAERTTLAWQRTALSLLGGAAVLARLTADQLGLLSLSGLAVVGPLTLWVVGVGGSRTRHRDGTPVRRRDGRSTAALCLGVVVLASLQIASVLVGRSGT